MTVKGTLTYPSRAAVCKFGAFGCKFGNYSEYSQKTAHCRIIFRTPVAVELSTL